jgi:hypothetical protein
MATIHFTSSDAFMDDDPRAVESADIEVEGYVEATYGCLRHGDDDALASFIDGVWELPDGRRFSDWAVEI